MANCASYVFCRWDKIHLFNKPKSLIAWVKNNHSAGDLEHEHGRRWEAICFYPGRNHRFTKRPTDVIEIDRTANNRHPTEKPVGVMEKLISSNEGNIVFDPYCGSGSTLLAARNCARKSIGIEIEEKYCEIAANRCRQGVLFG
jgi:site-specific DNA-methyltransferase (adenine-specific)